jgi:hypothetical protein
MKDEKRYQIWVKDSTPESMHQPLAGWDSLYRTRGIAEGVKQRALKAGYSVIIKTLVRP